MTIRRAIEWLILRWRGSPAMACSAMPVLQTKNWAGFDALRVLLDYRILLGVPKNRTSKPRKHTRKFAYTNLFAVRDNLVECQQCGAFHEMQTICGKCYTTVRSLTSEIKKKMMAFNPYKGEAQDRDMIVQFNDDDQLDQSMIKGRRVIELDRPRPTWFKSEFLSKK